MHTYKYALIFKHFDVVQGQNICQQNRHNHTKHLTFLKYIYIHYSIYVYAGYEAREEYKGYDFVKYIVLKVQKLKIVIVPLLHYDDKILTDLNVNHSIR